MKFELFPRKHLKPYDGMSITAEVWEQAHAEHRLADRAHRLYLHGSGIISGLEVQASDPPDQYVFISPGAAIDSAGNLIVVPEPVAYDFSNSAAGRLFLLLAHGEREIGGSKNAPHYRQDEFVITARATIPRRPTVELARIVLPKADAPIRDAADPLHPAPGTLDLRFRRQLRPPQTPLVHTLVIAEAGVLEDLSTSWDALGRAAARLDGARPVVDAASPSQLPDHLDDYDLFYLACESRPNKAVTEVVRRHLEAGRPLFVEALSPQADGPCREWLDSLQQPLSPLAANARLFRQPFLFGRPPVELAEGRLEEGPLTLYTTAAYALAWQGQRQGNWLPRADIRTLHEWGLNLLHYCLSKTRI